MARNFRVLLGSIGDVPVVAWAVNLPAPHNPANAAQIAASLNVGGFAQVAGAAGQDQNFANFVDLWVLTGGNPEDGTYPFNNLPAGFTVASQSLTAGIVFTAPGDRSVTLTALGSGSSNVLNNSGTAVFTYNTLQTAFQLAFEKLGISMTGLTGVGVCSVTFLFLTGTYILQSFTWTLDTANPVTPEEPIQLSSPPTATPPPLQFDHLRPKIAYTDLDGNPKEVDVEIITQETHLLIFFMPYLPGLDATKSIVIIGDGDGTQFSGSISLGFLTILIENGSGVYRIVPEKTNDTVYINSKVNDDTADVRIPRPFAKTGFIGG